jgi:hypothetical protein
MSATHQQSRFSLLELMSAVRYPKVPSLKKYLVLNCKIRYSCGRDGECGAGLNVRREKLAISVFCVLRTGFAMGSEKRITGISESKSCWALLQFSEISSGQSVFLTNLPLNAHTSESDPIRLQSHDQPS